MKDSACHHGQGGHGMQETYACSMLTKNRLKENLLFSSLLDVPFKA